MKKTYRIEGLDCANCAAKIEAKLRTLNGVDDLTITYATKQMKLSAKNPDQMIPYLFRFKIKLCFIGHGLQLTSSTLAGKCTS